MAVPYGYILGIAIILIVIGAVLIYGIPEANPAVGTWSLGTILLVLGVIVLIIWVIYVLWASRPAPRP